MVPSYRYTLYLSRCRSLKRMASNELDDDMEFGSSAEFASRQVDGNSKPSRQ